MAALTRRSALAAFLASVPTLATAASASDPFPAAIRRAQGADAADREAGRFAREIEAAGLPLPAGWRAYRADLEGFALNPSWGTDLGAITKAR